MEVCFMKINEAKLALIKVTLLLRNHRKSLSELAEANWGRKDNLLDLGQTELNLIIIQAWV